MRLQPRVPGQAVAWLVMAIAVPCVFAGEVRAVVPGDSFEDPFPVNALPFLSSGSTCGFGDDNLIVCSNYPSGASDVVYRYDPDHDMTVTISTCGSSFDGTFMVYDGARTIVACAPNYCHHGGYLSQLHLIGGLTYYVVIDKEGPALDCGAYILSIDECTEACQPVYLRCPAGAIQEGENSCAPGYVDDFNGGCIGVPCHATHVPCTGADVTVCGTMGNWPTYDVDTYEFELSAASRVTITVSGGRATLLYELFRLVNGALPGELVDSQRIYHGIAFDNMLGAGRYWVRLRTDERSRIPCDNQYMIQLSGLGCAPTPAQPSSWGGLKSMYR
ncbi:MAG: hypothetical protein ABI782_10830 [Anaerolineaceae bacterium]